MLPTFLVDLFSLQGQVALVTGASSGIGRHMAKTLAFAGASVVCAARRRDALERLVSEITSLNARASAVDCDLSREGKIDFLAAEASRIFGPPTILVNAAGINLRELPEDITAQSWNATLHLNLTVPFFLGRALVPGMIENGGGAVINIASLQSFRAFTRGMAYGASKGGIAQLTRAMAEAWSPHGVRVNAILPGFFPSELTQPVFDDAVLAGKHAQATAIGRNGNLADLEDRKSVV